MYQEPAAGVDVDLSASEFKTRLQETDGATLLDVRTPMEYQMGHIPGAVNVDIAGPGFADEITALDRNGRYFVYCRSGSRSATACAFMKQLGFSHVHNLAYGIIDWDGEIE